MDSVNQLQHANPLIDSPPEVRLPSNATRLLTSWKLWALALVFAVVAIGVSLSMRGVRRHLAFKFLDEHHCPYELTTDSEWITEWFGDWAKALRDVDSIDLLVVSDESFSHISAFSETRRLSTNHFNDVIVRDREFECISDRGLRSLQKLTLLEEVHCYFGGLNGDQMASFFSALLPLRSVTLHTMKPNSQTIAALAGLPALTELRIYMCDKIEDEEFRDLTPIPHLRVLTLASVESQKANWLEQATDLRELEIDRSTISPEIMQCIANLQELQSLSLASCDIVDHDALKCLESISLPREAVTWETLDTLRRMPNLKTITVDVDIHDPELREAVEQEWEYEYLFHGYAMFSS